MVAEFSERTKKTFRLLGGISVISACRSSSTAPYRFPSLFPAYCDEDDESHGPITNFVAAEFALLTILHHISVLSLRLVIVVSEISGSFKVSSPVYDLFFRFAVRSNSSIALKGHGHCFFEIRKG